MTAANHLGRIEYLGSRGDWDVFVNHQWVGLAARWVIHVNGHWVHHPYWAAYDISGNYLGDFSTRYEAAVKIRKAAHNNRRTSTMAHEEARADLERSIKRRNAQIDKVDEKLHELAVEIDSMKQTKRTLIIKRGELDATLESLGGPVPKPEKEAPTEEA